MDDPHRHRSGSRAAGRPSEPGHQGATSMGSTPPAATQQLTPAPAAASSPGPLVPVAFVGRTSTLTVQNPIASMRRQARKSAEALPAGFTLVAWYWDIES